MLIFIYERCFEFFGDNSFIKVGSEYITFQHGEERFFYLVCIRQFRKKRDGALKKVLRLGLDGAFFFQCS